MIIVGTESTNDAAAISELNREAFGGETEARIIEKLRDRGAPVISLVAKDDGRVVGHILFSPVTIEGAELKGAGLGPLAVVDSYRKKGVDTLLVKAGLESIRYDGYDFAVVAGDRDYYRRFGFEPAIVFNLRSELPVREEDFLARAIRPGSLNDVSGIVHYMPEFGKK